MEKYSDYSDEELIIRYREGEQQIVDYLMEKYKNVVRSKAGTGTQKSRILSWTSIRTWSGNVPMPCF